MGLLLKQLFSFIKLLNSETGSFQIASGVAAGFILGMTPTLSLQSFLVFVLIFAFRIQAGAAFIAAFFFAFPAFLLDPVFDSVGNYVLTLEVLKPSLTFLYNLPIVPFTRFNNSVVMGAGVVTLVLSPVVFLVSLFLINKYRVHIVQKFQGTKFWKAVKATSLYQWYHKYDELYGS